MSTQKLEEIMIQRSESTYSFILNRANAIKANVVKVIVVLLLLLLLPVSPVFAAVDHGYDGGDNYVGVQWHLGISSSFDAGPSGKGANVAVPGGFGFTPTQSPDYWVAVTIRHNGNITCDERHDFNDDALDYEGKWYWLCGQPAIIAGNGTYYNVPGVQGAEGWIDSPDHCGYTGFSGGYACDRYWYVNWSSPAPPLPTPPPPQPVIIPSGIVSFNNAPYGGWQTGCHYPGSQGLLATIQLTADNHDCGATCANTTGCAYFVKTTDGPHGTCFLKSGPADLFAVAGDPNYYVCGYVANPKS